MTDKEDVQPLSPAVNTEAPVLDDSVRCRMAGICEGLDACGRGMQPVLQALGLQSCNAIFRCL